MDITAIISTVITILILGSGLYTAFKKSIAAHKTTQGKVQAAVDTAAKNQSTIDALAKDVADLKNQLKGVKL